MSTNRPTRQPTLLAFVDTETTGLDPLLHDAWEIAVILRADGEDEEHIFRIKPDLATADPQALEINRYHERTSHPDWTWDDPHLAATRLQSVLDGAVMVGSNVAFDAEMLSNLLGRYYSQPRPWHYRTVDVVTLTVGSLYGRASERTRNDCDASWYGKVARAVGWPWKSHDVSRLVQVEPPTADIRHTALGDARWARTVWDSVTVPDAFFAASDEQLAQMAGDALSRLYGGQL
ncbi:3'-5' exonuclease [Streptomyces cellulosae]|uniref:3'-5' exonuclease n=1 Tax=Streptomyces cellulosae TaxID=1968 RepID=UPI0004C67345|nr:3'-5' exonuclease [Streptomyces cellulosae]